MGGIGDAWGLMAVELFLAISAGEKSGNNVEFDIILLYCSHVPHFYRWSGWNTTD
jgi:hypothetical protein